MKKALSVILIAAMILSITACNKSTSSSDASQTADAVTENNAAVTEQTPQDAELPSPPVAVDENGDVDMSVALAYETDFDKLIADLEAKEVNLNDTVSENSNEKTQRVFEWLRENYGKNMITAQQLGDTKGNEDILYYNITGDLPAIKGYDFIFNTGAYVNDGEDSWTNAAIKWHTESNGLVVFCWHWNVPRDIDDLTQGYAFYRDEIVNFDIVNAVTPGTKEYEVIVHDIDTIAIELKKLEAAGVPVMWRPLHEAGGTWFWWGLKDKATQEKQVYQKLWYMLYDRLENYHKLTNLIWVWNGQNRYMEVNPNTYDISGIDTYPASVDHSARNSDWTKLEGLTYEGKMMALTEVGYIPDPVDVFETGCTWLYYMPWNFEFIWETTTSGGMVADLNGTPQLNTDKMSEEFLKGVFANEHVITWSDMPEWGGTEKKLPEKIATWEYFKVD